MHHRVQKKTQILQILPLKTQPYQIDAALPTWTSPMIDALGATNASLSTTGALSNTFMSVRCLDTKKNGITELIYNWTQCTLQSQKTRSYIMIKQL